MFVFLFSFLIKSENYDFSSCLNELTNYDMFKCWASKLPPLENSVTSEFMSCLLLCKKSETPDKCASDCTTSSPCSSTECLNCIQNCSKVKDPIHNTQCNLGCYRHKRIDPYRDFKSVATSDCENFHAFFRKFKEENPYSTEKEIRESIEMICANDYDALPVCHAIAKKTWAQTYQYLLENMDSTEFCVKMGFIYE